MATREPDRRQLPLFALPTEGSTAGMRGDQVWCAGYWLNYTYRRSPRRKTLAISVYPDLRVTVAAPMRVPLTQIREFVRQRARWITKWRRKFEQNPPQQHKRTYDAGERHDYLGESYPLELCNSLEPSVVLTGDRVRISLRGHTDPGQIASLLDNWYDTQAELVLREQFEAGWSAFGRAGEDPPRLTIRRMKTRWGSCNPQGRITLNRDLIKTPIACIDYVIAHEICHLWVSNHSPRFWARLAQLMPDYQARRELLNTFKTI